jgi:D-sedoheptulose 7-phosphate isomerase
VSHVIEAAEYCDRLQTALKDIDLEGIADVIGLIDTAWREGRQIIVFGNGGSALTALHYITDWNKSIPLMTGRAFRGRTLVDNIGLLTAFSNDVSYEDVFVEQLRFLLNPGDLVIAISGSGNSPNVLAGARFARDAGAKVVAIVGYGGGKLRPIADAAFTVPVRDMQICEDLHFTFGHIVMRSLTAAVMPALATS